MLPGSRIGAVVEYCSLTFAATVLVADALVHLLPHALEAPVGL